MVSDFKSFWKNHGPFKYALTSCEFPPILLEPEEWIFSNSSKELLKELMQWEKRKMKIVKAPFNKNKTNVFKPDDLIPWKILNFPEEWEGAVCKSFTPMGHLTEHVISEPGDEETGLNINEKTEQEIEVLFFSLLKKEIHRIGYDLLQPEAGLGKKNYAFVESYLKEWENDE